jgi:putative transposase
LAWCPKYRKKIIQQDKRRKRAEHLIKKIREEYGITINEMEVTKDHLHLVVSFPEKLSTGEVIKPIKSIRARELFRKFTKMKKRLWSGELLEDVYSARTAGERMPRQITDKYIHRHHDSEQGPAQLF